MERVLGENAVVSDEQKVELKGRVARQQGWRPVGLFGSLWPLSEVRAVPGLLHVPRWVVVDGWVHPAGFVRVAMEGKERRACTPQVLGGF